MQYQTKPNFFNVDQSQLFHSKSKHSKLSKSVLSKSLSVLDKVKRAYHDLRDDTSRTLKRDVKLSDLIIPTPQESSKIRFPGLRNNNIGIDGLEDFEDLFNNSKAPKTTSSHGQFSKKIASDQHFKQTAPQPDLMNPKRNVHRMETDLEGFAGASRPKDMAKLEQKANPENSHIPNLKSQNKKSTFQDKDG